MRGGEICRRWEVERWIQRAIKEEEGGVSVARVNRKAPR